MCSPNTYLLATPCFAVDKLGFKVQGSSIQPYKGHDSVQYKKTQNGRKCAYAWMILYGLWTDAISAVEYVFFEPKIAFVIYGSEQT